MFSLAEIKFFYFRPEFFPTQPSRVYKLSEKVKVCGKSVVFVVPENAFSLRPEILIVYYCDDNCWYNFLIIIVIHHLPQLFHMYEKIVREHFAEPFFAFESSQSI